jgi:nucleoside-diphosphate-sugar epimerase
MSRILVTGSTGFVGACLQEVLSTSGHEVVGTTTGLPSESRLYCNIEDRDAVAALMHDVQPEVVIHCAAISSVTAGRPMEYYRVNTVGTENLADCFAAVPARKRFVFVSTAGVYGNQDVEVLHEGLCPLPVHHYGLSKLCAERVVHNYSDAFEFRIVRPFNIVGEAQNQGFIVPKLVNAFHDRLDVVRLGNLDVYRDYIDINDAVKIIAMLALGPTGSSEVVNLCSGKPVSLKDLIEVLDAITGHSIEIEVAPEFVRRNEVWRLLGDTSKLARLLGGMPVLIPIEETLRRMLAAREREQS